MRKKYYHVEYAGKRENPVNKDKCVVLKESQQTIHLVRQLKRTYNM